MDVRNATAADRELVHALYRELMDEWPPPVYEGDVLDDNLREVDGAIDQDRVFLAGEDGFAIAWIKKRNVGYLSDLYVRPSARGRGIASELVRDVAAALRAQGATHMTLNVDVGNDHARAVYRRWQFREESVDLVVDLEMLEQRLSRAARGESFGSVHAQTDDVPAVERVIRRYGPQLKARSAGTIVAPPRSGWIAVYDDAGDREPEQLRRLARELSGALGVVALAIGVEEGAVAHYVLFDRGKAVDEYMSVPEFFGPKPPGEVVALAANPSLVNRLTGADRRTIRSAAVQAHHIEDLPPAAEIVAAIGAAMSIEGIGHGFAAAVEIPGALRIER